MDFCTDLCKRLQANPNLILLDVLSPEWYNNYPSKLMPLTVSGTISSINVSQLSDQMEVLSSCGMQR